MTDEFNTTITTFIRDMKTTFPEYTAVLERWPQSEWYEYCKKIYPPNFFHIMYKNSDFATANESNNSPVYLLPEIDFRQIMGSNDISQHTRDTIWQYLRIILFSVVSNVTDSSAFSDAAHLFGAISPEDMQTKINEVIGDMQNMFNEMHANDASGNDEPPPIPTAEGLQDTLHNIFGSKIGKFAQELAEEWASEFGIDLNETGTSNNGITQMFEKLLKDPSKFFKLIQRVGDRFKAKMDSGEFTEREIRADIQEMAGMFKNMPGMEKWGNMFAGMSHKGGRGNGSAAAAAAASSELTQLRKQMEYEQMKARLQANRDKVKKRAAAVAAKVAYKADKEPLSDAELVEMFNTPPPSAKPKNKGKK